MTRVSVIATALVVALVGVSNTAKAQDTLERTFLTFSGTAEMPGVTLPAGTYVFKLADTGSRNVVQVFDKDERKIIGQWLFVPAQRRDETQETVVMFKETAAGTTPAVQYWFYPGRRTGKEFVYPKSQALKIAARTHQTVLSTDGEVTANSRVASIDASGKETEWKPEQSASNRADDSGVIGAGAASSTAAARPAEPRQPAFGGSGGNNQTAQSNTQVARAQELPRTASPLGLIALVGLISLAVGLAVRFARQ